MAKKYDIKSSDAQATKIEPVAMSAFKVDEYLAYESGLLTKCGHFVDSPSGVLVYRWMRVGEVFSWGCADRKKSLEWQLGALEKSMAFKADVPNFLEPWYGIGTAPASWGIDYIWEEGLAPAVKPTFRTIQEALEYPVSEIKDSNN